MTGRIGISEANTLGRQCVDIWGVVKGAAIAAKISPAEVVDEEEDNIFWGSEGDGRSGPKDQAPDDLQISPSRKFHFFGASNFIR